MSIRVFPSTGIGCKWWAREQDTSVECSGFGISKAIQTTDVFVGVRSYLANYGKSSASLFSARVSAEAGSLLLCSALGPRLQPRERVVSQI